MKFETQPSVGIIGAGWVAHNCYLPGLMKAGVKVSAVTDIDEDRGRYFSQKLADKAVYCKTIEEFFEQEFQLVIITTPNVLHVPLSRLSLQTGRYVLCEKPLGISFTEVEGLLPEGAAERLYVSTPYRFRDDVLEVLKLVQNGELGKVYRIRATWTRARGIPQPSSWYTRRELSGGGVFIDLAPHLIDIALLILGWPKMKTVNAWMGNHLRSVPGRASSWMKIPFGINEAEGLIDVEYQASALYTFEQGSLLELNVAWAGFHKGDSTIIEIEGTLGRLLLRTLFGYSPHAEDDAPTLSVLSRQNVYTRVLNHRRLPALDFGRMLRAVISKRSFDGVEAANYMQGAEVMKLVQSTYRAAG